MSGFVRTVLGDVASEELGPIYAHEHLLTRPMGEQIRDDPDLVLDDEQRGRRRAADVRPGGGSGAGRGGYRGAGPQPGGAASPGPVDRRARGGRDGHVCEQYWRGALDLKVKPERALWTASCGT
jgi:hypothetical protein